MSKVNADIQQCLPGSEFIRYADNNAILSRSMLFSRTLIRAVKLKSKVISLMSKICRSYATYCYYGNQSWIHPWIGLDWMRWLWPHF